MKKLKLDKSTGFGVIETHKNLQAAQMTLSPDASTGGPYNLHRNSDQWLFVVEGKAEAIVNGKTIKLAKYDLVVIEAGETHEIKNIGKKDLVTLNFYTPPEY